MVTRFNASGDHSLKLLELSREYTALHQRISDARYALVDGNLARQAIPCRVLDNWFDYICGTIDYNTAIGGDDVETKC